MPRDGVRNEFSKDIMKSDMKGIDRMKCFIFLGITACLCAAVEPASAGKAQKWNELPESVRATILANGGTMNGRVDK